MKSIICSISKIGLQEIVQSSHSYAEVLRKLNLKPGATTITLKKRMDDENIDYSHLKQGQGSRWNKGKQLISEKDILSNFCKESTMDRQSIKKYLLRLNLIRYICCLCGQPPLWNKKEMTLILDHENGIRNDNRLSNLRFVCPNCNSQLPTTCRKGNNKSVEWNKDELIAKVNSGKSLRKCLLEMGLSDGWNYEKIKTIIGSTQQL